MSHPPVAHYLGKPNLIILLPSLLTHRHQHCCLKADWRPPVALVVEPPHRASYYSILSERRRQWGLIEFDQTGHGASCAGRQRPPIVCNFFLSLPFFFKWGGLNWRFDPFIQKRFEFVATAPTCLDECFDKKLPSYDDQFIRSIQLKLHGLPLLLRYSLIQSVQIFHLLSRCFGGF